MKRLVLAGVSALAFLTSAGGISRVEAADLPYQCETLKAKESIQGSEYKDCAESVKDQFNAFQAAAKLIWKVVANPTAIFEAAPLSELRSSERIGVRVSGVYWAVRNKLNPYAECYKEDCFSGLRALYANPQVLGSAYDKHADFVVNVVWNAVIFGAVNGDIIAASPLLDKPFDVKLAASSARWYDKGCWQPVDQQEDAEACRASAWFATEFKNHYGVDVTSDRVWVLGFLFRRYQEGGPDLVAQYQRIGKDLGERLAK